MSIKAWLPRLRLINIKVDSFGDGRVFTLARDLLALGFAGEIRVSGPVMPDQTAFFERVGVHVLSLPSGDRSESFNRLKLKNRFFYQTSSDKAVPVQQQRHKRDERAAQ